MPPLDQAEAEEIANARSGGTRVVSLASYKGGHYYFRMSDGQACVVPDALDPLGIQAREQVVERALDQIRPRGFAEARSAFLEAVLELSAAERVRLVDDVLRVLTKDVPNAFIAFGQPWTPVRQEGDGCVGPGELGELVAESHVPFVAELLFVPAPVEPHFAIEDLQLGKSTLFVSYGPGVPPSLFRIIELPNLNLPNGLGEPRAERKRGTLIYPGVRARIRFLNTSTERRAFSAVLVGRTQP